MTEIYCRNCGKPVGSVPHTVGGPDCVPLSLEEKTPTEEERGEQARKYDRGDLVRQGLHYRKTLD